MPTNFLVESGESSSTPSSVSNFEEQPVDREPLRVLVIGSRQGVVRTIQTLYRLRFAEVREWSPLMPGPNPGEVMSILTRYLSTN
ncbi:hypothetical protein K9N68_07475 [Kovacikia minuta CCNUW1]|uniref:hypothetical protein n=1 Tax=Kovacikia minuta TaxID=2931930 RepID=UPI001CCBFA5A|nr:hypothetical protein [Kovacikia minuta]UBF27745.1 hypothetical protein K9N68_07475 [Kovacikia minuta CCNUW1]